MTRQKQKKSVRTQNTRNSFWARMRTRLRWGHVVAALIGVALICGGVIWAVSAHNSNAPRFDMTVGAPDTQQFRDDNYMTMAPGDGPTAGMPDVNNDREMSKPASLRVDFEQTRGEYTPAMRMDINDADLADNIKITPFIKGTWHMAGASRLFFAPDAGWPAAQKFTVTVSRKLLNPDVRIGKLHATFETPRLMGTINSFDVYPDLNRRQSMIGVAIVWKLSNFIV